MEFQRRRYPRSPCDKKKNRYVRQRTRHKETRITPMTGQPANIAGETLAWQRVAPYKDSANLQHAEVNREGSQVTLPLRHRPSPLQGGHLDIAVAFQGRHYPCHLYDQKKTATKQSVRQTTGRAEPCITPTTGRSGNISGGGSLCNASYRTTAAQIFITRKPKGRGK